MKKNLAEIIHNLKLSYSRAFGEKYKYSKNLDIIINTSAHKIKNGYIGIWYEEDGIKLIRFEKCRWT